MKKTIYVMVALLLTACNPFGGAPGNPTNPPAGPSPGISPPDFSSAALGSALSSGNLDIIEKASCPYCVYYTYNSSGKAVLAAKETPDAGTDSSKAAFGCFLVAMSRLVESAPASDFLAAFGEPAIHVQADILDKSNPDALCTKLSQMKPKKYYQMFSKLPFNNYQFRHSNPKKFFQEMLGRAKSRGIALSQLQDDLFALDVQLDQLLQLLTQSRADASFRFVIPKESCQASKKDIVVSKIDLEGFNGILGGLRVFVNLLHAYTIGLDPARFVGGNTSVSNDAVNEREFVADANGVGGDQKKFAELVSGRGDLGFLKPVMLDSLKSLIALLDGIHNKSDSQVFGNLLMRQKYRKFFTNLNKTAKDLKNSLEHPGVLTPLSQLGHSHVSVDVGGFLSNLPDPKTTNNADPFVYRYGIKGVVAFWKTLLSGIVKF